MKYIDKVVFMSLKINIEENCVLSDHLMPQNTTRWHSRDAQWTHNVGKTSTVTFYQHSVLPFLNNWSDEGFRRSITVIST